MRKELKKLNNQRIKIFATVSRFGTKKNWNGFDDPTICFTNLVDVDNNKLTDHIWFTVGKTIASLQLQEGDKVSFEARVSSYTKGFVRPSESIDNRTVDYKLNNPTKFSKEKIIA